MSHLRLDQLHSYLIKIPLLLVRCQRLTSKLVIKRIRTSPSISLQGADEMSNRDEERGFLASNKKQIVFRILITDDRGSHTFSLPPAGKRVKTEIFRNKKRTVSRGIIWGVSQIISFFILWFLDMVQPKPS
ncbi:hypothetical protein TNCV_4315141 [Trichonephila clavipes]|nr:hypothetical protein TNCV_4315141 [Trichonephila clavipes]